MKENHSCDTRHCSQGPDLGTLKGHQMSLCRGGTPDSEFCAHTGDTVLVLPEPGLGVGLARSVLRRDPPRLPLPPLVCSSHLVFQPNDTWSCPWGIKLFVVFGSDEHSALGQPGFWSLQVALPPLLSAQPSEFPADTSPQCQHR